MEHGHNFFFAHGPQYTVLISWQVAPLPLQCTSSADGGIWGGVIDSRRLTSSR